MNRLFIFGLTVATWLVSACNPTPVNPCPADAGPNDTCEPKQFCGGFAGIACPGGGKCVDDPSDSCDPNNGGADCGGICQCIETVLCIQGYHFDSSPSVCACVPPENSDPCATVRCRAGTHCEATGGTASCVADTNPCAAILCLAGTTCVVRDGKGTCVEPPQPVTCGENTCTAGQYCCNSSCGICAPMGAACIQIACE
jgi:hypothetical protein